MMKAIIDGMIVLPDAIVGGHILLYEGDRITDIVPRKGFHLGQCTDLIDANGGFVVPGFINEHIHGCAGADTMDENEEALATIQSVLPKTGVTSFLPTTMTYDRPRIERALSRIRRAKKNCGARILGAHMEGPFISTAYKGAQKESNIAQADFSWIEPYEDVVKIITLAPETLKDKTFLKECADHDIIVSVGHSGATYEQVMDCMEKSSFYHITHMYNAMTPLHHRRPGIVGAALLDPKAHCELICDNLHVHPAAQKLVYRMKGRDGIILITDSLRACRVSSESASRNWPKRTSWRWSVSSRRAAKLSICADCARASDSSESRSSPRPLRCSSRRASSSRSRRAASAASGLRSSRMTSSTRATSTATSSAIRSKDVSGMQPV